MRVVQQKIVNRKTGNKAQADRELSQLSIFCGKNEGGKHMKKIIAVLLCIIFVFSSVGFASDNSIDEEITETTRSYDEPWFQKVESIQTLICSENFIFSEVMEKLFQQKHFNDAFYGLGEDVRSVLYQHITQEDLYELRVYVKDSLIRDSIYYHELQKTEPLKRSDVYYLSSYYDNYVELTRYMDNTLSEEARKQSEDRALQNLNSHYSMQAENYETYLSMMQTSTSLNLEELLGKISTLDDRGANINLLEVQDFKNYLYQLFGFKDLASEAEMELSRMASLPMALSAGTVTSYSKVTWGISTGDYTVNNIQAFCAEYQKTWPLRNSSISSIYQSTNEILRKALYYGYNGPGNTLGSDAKALVLTSIAISDANIGEAATGVKATYDEFYWDIVNNPSKYPTPPSNFKAYIAVTESTSAQDLAFYQIDPTGYVSVSKSSENPEITNGNSCYSLAGAVFTLYTDSACTSAIGTLTTDAAGNTGTLSVNAGTYYLKETSAPKGYSISSKVHTVSVSSGHTTVVYATNKPQMDPVGVLLGKVDAETNANKPQNSASLKGAQFTVKFYAGLWDEGIDPATLGKSPARTWVFETDEDGFCEYNSQYLVSGNDLFIGSNGMPSLPVGTITIQETQAPEGYLLNKEVFVRQIKSIGNAENIYTYNEPTIPEQIFEVQLTKYQSGTDIPIPGVEFEHAKPDGSTERLTTDTDGKLSFKGLQYGSHTIREISVMEGYVLNENIITFTVNKDNSVVNTSEIDATKGDVVFEMTEEGNIRLYVYDNVDPYSLIVHKGNHMENFLEGAEFTLYADAECQTELTKEITDTNGELRFEALSPERKYYLKETKAPAGYRIPVDEDGNPYVYEIYATSTPVKEEFVLYINGEAYAETSGQFHVSGPANAREAHVSIVNDIGVVLPHSGSSMTMIMLMLGTVFCCLALVVKRRSKE